MTLYPYAAAAASLVSDEARNLFAKLTHTFDDRPEYIRGMVEKRYGRRNRHQSVEAATARAA